MYILKNKEDVIKSIEIIALMNSKDLYGRSIFIGNNRALFITDNKKYVTEDIAGKTSPEFNTFEAVCFYNSALNCSEYSENLEDDIIKKALKLDKK